VVDAMSDAKRVLEALSRKHGELMTGDETAMALKLGSRGALNMARARGVVTLEAIKVTGRRGHLYRTAEVAELIASWLSEKEVGASGRRHP
jgi:hypothetical protein